MKNYQLGLLLIVLIIVSCKQDQPSADAVTFIRTLSSLTHSDLKMAFVQANSALHYTEVAPASINILEARKSSSDKMGPVLIGSKLIPNSAPGEYGILLLVFDRKDTTSLLTLLKDELKPYKKTIYKGKQVWMINKWMLEIKEPNTLKYYPATTRSMFEGLDLPEL